MTIPEQLKDLRAKAGLTQSQLAEKLGPGYQKQHVNAIESGKTKTGLEVISRWANACGYKAEIIFNPLI